MTSEGRSHSPGGRGPRGRCARRLQGTGAVPTLEHSDLHANRIRPVEALGAQICVGVYAPVLRPGRVQPRRHARLTLLVSAVKAQLGLTWTQLAMTVCRSVTWATSDLLVQQPATGGEARAPLKTIRERGYVSTGSCGTCTPPTPICRAFVTVSTWNWLARDA